MTKQPYIFGLDHFKVENCRSKGDHNDSDWLSIAVTAGLTLFPSQTKQIGGNLHAGDPIDSVFVGPFYIDENDYITLTFTVTNLSHSDDQGKEAGIVALKVGGAALAALEGLASAGFAGLVTSKLEQGVVAAVSASFEGIAELLGWTPSDPNCNGEVLTRTIVFPPGELKRRVPLSIGPNLETARSPSECGNDPHSTVSYGFRAELPAANVAAVSSIPMGTQVFALSEDRRVWSKYFDPQNLGLPDDGGWSKWFPLGDNTFMANAGISAVSSTQRGTQVFVLGEDRRVWTKFFDPQNPGRPEDGGWSAWFPLGDNTFIDGAGIACASSTQRGTQVFVLGEDRRVWTKFFDPEHLGLPEDGGWSKWFPLGDNTFLTDAGISAVSSTQRGSQVFVLGEDHRVWTKFFDPQNPGRPEDGGWSAWFPLGDNTFLAGAGIASASSSQRGTQVFVLGEDRRVWTKFFDPEHLGLPEDGGWSKWFPLGAKTFLAHTGLAGVSSKPRGTQVFAISDDHRIWSKFFDPQNLGTPEDGGWSAWFPL